MRKLVTIGLALVTALAVAAVAIADYNNPDPIKISVNAKIKPSKGGSKKKPKNASTDIKFDVNQGSYSTLAGISYSLPKSIVVSGKGFPTCSVSQVKADESKCPKKSKVGTGASTALAGVDGPPINFAVNVYVTGKKGLILALKQDPLPAEGGVEANFPAKVTKKAISFSIPPSVQQPAPGLYSFVTSVTANLGPAKVGKNFLISRVGCFGKKDKETVTVKLAANPKAPAKSSAKGTDSAPCKK